MSSLRVDDVVVVDVEQGGSCINGPLPDYSICARVEIEWIFERFSEDPMVVRTWVKHRQSILTSGVVGRLAKSLHLPKPYYLWTPGPEERVCFPKENEIGDNLASSMLCYDFHWMRMWRQSSHLTS